MTLYVDETENEEFFIVSGLLVNSSSDVELAFKQFKKNIHGAHISAKEKQELFTEFKATQLDRHYQKIKFRMLDAICTFDNSIIYSCHIKKGPSFLQSRKEDVYVLLLSKIVASLEEETDIIFDTFNKMDFESRITNTILPYSNVSSIQARDSRTEAGLQFIDNICSTIRLHLSGKDQNGFYKIIEDRVQNV